MDKKTFFETLKGRPFWYLSGETTRLCVMQYHEDRNLVICSATLKNGMSLRSYYKADYLFNELSGKEIRFL